MRRRGASTGITKDLCKEATQPIMQAAATPKTLPDELHVVEAAAVEKQSIWLVLWTGLKNYVVEPLARLFH